MTSIPEVQCIIEGGQPYPQYTDEERSFHRSTQIKSAQPFAIVQYEIPAGQFKGMTALVFVPTSRFPFEKLPLELRQAIYRLVYATNDQVTLRRGLYPYVTPQQQLVKLAALLHVNRAISSEALEFLWSSQRFVADSMEAANDFLRHSRRGRQYITDLTATRSGSKLVKEFYRLLTYATRLRSLSLQISTTAPATLEQHLDSMWMDLRLYLLARKRRLRDQCAQARHHSLHGRVFVEECSECQRSFDQVHHARAASAMCGTHPSASGDSLC